MQAEALLRSQTQTQIPEGIVVMSFAIEASVLGVKICVSVRFKTLFEQLTYSRHEERAPREAPSLKALTREASTVLLHSLMKNCRPYQICQ